GFRAHTSDLGHGGLVLGSIPPRDDYRGARFGESARHAEADTSIAPGHNGNAVGEIEHFHLSTPIGELKPPLRRQADTGPAAVMGVDYILKGSQIAVPGHAPSSLAILSLPNKRRTREADPISVDEKPLREGNPLWILCRTWCQSARRGAASADAGLFLELGKIAVGREAFGIRQCRIVTQRPAVNGVANSDFGDLA